VRFPRSCLAGFFPGEVPWLRKPAHGDEGRDAPVPMHTVQRTWNAPTDALMSSSLRAKQAQRNGADLGGKLAEHGVEAQAGL
jgi:hypothetical protein